MKGSAGSLTFRRSGGRTIVSERITETKVSRTEPQQRHRTKWANIVQMWKGLGPELRDAFSNKGAGRSDYNKFVSINMQRQAVYLAKSQVSGGACVAAPYQITQGSLPAIVITGEGRNAATNIFIADLTLGASTTVSDFSKSVVNNNPDYRYGDQISYFIIKQKVNEATGIPYCQFKANAVILDAANDAKLWEHVPKNGFSTVDGCIGHSGNDGDCVFAWVHSRKSNGKTLVSPQQLINANSKLAEYQSDAAFLLAANSYGVGDGAFLTPSGESVSSAGAGGNSSSQGGGGGDSL